MPKEKFQLSQFNDEETTASWEHFKNWVLINEVDTTDQKIWRPLWVSYLKGWKDCLEKTLEKFKDSMR